MTFSVYLIPKGRRTNETTVHLVHFRTKSTYRAATSLNAFRRAMYVFAGTDVGFYPKYDHEYEMENQIERDLGLDPWNPVIVEHETIWDFYKAVGWDYKKKKFLEVAG